VRSSLRIAGFAALALFSSVPGTASACEPLPPPEPPPRTAAESDSEFAARSAKWYSGLYESERIASLPGRIAGEERLWAAAQRVVLARVRKIGSIRLGGEGQYYKSPLVELRALKWLKGNPSPRRLKVHFLSANTCDFGGAGNAAYDAELGEVYLLFYKPGPIDPRNILDTFSKDRVVTERSRKAFDLAGSGRP
jgi:hypothetical protein